MEYTEDLYHGYRRIQFTFEGRDAILVFPKKAEQKRRWLLKTEYFDAFPEFELEMVRRGFHLAFVKNETRWHKPSDDDAKAHFCAFLRKEFGLAGKCMPVGMSCGGMQAIYFAAKYPECVAALNLYAPVVNLLSCPCALGDAKISLYDDYVKNTGRTLTELLGYRDHPLDNMDPLVENRIPLFMVSGDSDTVVPYHENGKYLVEHYRKHGAPVEEILVPGGDHHPHCLPDPTPLIEWTLRVY